MTQTEQTYTIRYNRTTDHIEGLAIRSAGSDTDYALTACPALSRNGTKMARGKQSADLNEVLSAFGRNRKACVKCAQAVEAMKAA